MIFVTGGTGLLGSRLIYDLIKDGKRVRALNRIGSSLNLFNRWIENEQQLSSLVEWVEGDMLNMYSLEEGLKNCDIVYHCAAIVSFDPKLAKEMERINMDGTANLINACIEKGDIKHFCYVSSVASLGRDDPSHITDEHSEWMPGSHNSNYAISKYGGEREAWRGIAEGLPVVIVNPSIILGPGNWNCGSAEIFYRIYKGFNFYTDGTSGFVDVRDVSRAILMLADKGISGERYILNAENISFKKIFDEIARELNVKSPSLNVPHWLSAIVWRLEVLRCMFTGKSPFITKESARSAHSLYRYSSEKIKALGFEFMPVSKSIKDTVAYLKADLEK